MPNPLFRPPRHLVKEWPEVFEDLYMNTMPVVYVDLVNLEFSNGRIWQINVKEQLVHLEPDSVAKKLLDIFNEYQSEISKIDFKVDITRLKLDIQNSTKKML